ncbi:MAG TPA: YetF domain-containing protein [Dehalococcoidia bacterium]
MWHDIWLLQVPWWERVLRAAVVYAFVVIALRLAGKRELGQLNTLDLVVLLFLSNILQNSIIGNDVSVTGGIIGAATLLLINYVTLRVLFLFPRIDRIIEGDATPLVENGRVIGENLKRELLTKEELTVACHKQGLYSLDEVERAYLEPGGAITIFAKRPTPEERQSIALEQRLDTLLASLQRIEARLGSG